MNYIIIPIIWAAILFLWYKLFQYLKILDKPWKDNKDRKKGVPTMQWLFVYIAFLSIVAIIFPQYFWQQLFLWFLAWSSIIILFELLDELNYIWKIKLKLHPAIRLCAHILAAILAVYIWDIQITELIMWDQIYIIQQRVFIIFFTLWSIVCINAINRFDGVYAQASWVSSVGFLTIFLLIKFVVLNHYTGILPENEKTLVFVQNISFILFILSFLSTLIEYKPLALLRDMGTMFFGFSIAYLSVVWGVKIWTVLVVLSLVIFDGIRVGIHRVFILKKSLIKWDYTHLHYRLLRLWRNKGEVRSFVRIFSVVMMILMLLQWANRTNKLIIFLVMAVLFFGINAYLFRKKKLPCGFDTEK